MSSPRFASFDLLATPVAVLNAHGQMLAVNAALEDVLGQSRRSLEGHALAAHFVDPKPLHSALLGVRNNEFAALRYEAALRRMHHSDHLPVHVIIAPSERSDEVIVELLPVEQKTRQEREERLLEQAGKVGLVLLGGGGSDSAHQLFWTMFLGHQIECSGSNACHLKLSREVWAGH